MPGMVGGFGNKQISILSLIKTNNNLSTLLKSKRYCEETIDVLPSKLKFNIKFCSYLAGLIEGDGTFAIHSKKSTAKKYSPKIIIVFKESDLPLAQYLKNIINCGTILKKPNRGYIL
jgi:hypothetical protein